jgi:hypothetical protein
MATNGGMIPNPVSADLIFKVEDYHLLSFS